MADRYTNEKNGMPLSEQAYIAIKKGIIAGKYTPGSDLQQLALSKDLEISRTPIREALLRLSQEGLVHLIPSKGAIVNHFSVEDMQDCFEARALLESSAAFSAIHNLCEKAVNELEEIVEKQQKAMNREDISQIYKYDTEFHHNLLQNTRNKRILTLIKGLTDESEVHRVRMMASPERIQKSINEHRGIIEAIRSKDNTKVKELLFNHLTNFCKETINEWLQRH